MRSSTTTTTTTITTANTIDQSKPIEVKTLIDAIKTKELKQVLEFVNKNGNDCVFQNDENSFSSMHWAAFNNNIEIARFLIDCKANPLECSNQRLQKPIHWAATKGDVDMVNLLLSHGENINIRDKKGYTPLITAAQYGHIPLVSFLIGRGANIEIEDENGDNCLHWAAYKGQSELVSLLIFFGLNPRRQDNFGQTPLHLACINGTLPTIKILSELIDLNVRDNNGNTPLSISKGRGHMSAFEYLERQKIYKFSKLFDIRTFIFGPVDNAKGMFVFVHLVLFIFQYPLYFYYALPLTYDDYKIFNQIYWVLNVAFWISLYVAHWKEPGYLRKNTEGYTRAIRMMTYKAENKTLEDLQKRNARLCHTCKIVRPYRSSHCKSCNRCVSAFDHHCPYIHNCVGYNNRIWFFMFITAVFIVALSDIRFCYIILYDSPYSYPLYVGLFISIIFSFMGFTLVGYSGYNIIRNLTTNEAAKTSKYEYLKDTNGRFKNIFDKGFIYNIKYYFHLIAPSHLETSEFEFNNDFNL